jgi:hypothetical protein
MERDALNAFGRMAKRHAAHGRIRRPRLLGHDPALWRRGTARRR